MENWNEAISSDNKVTNDFSKINDSEARERLPESERHLALTVDVLTSKACLEDGLEDATALLINLSQCSSLIKYMIIILLVKGVIELFHIVQKHINNLMVELRELNEAIKNEKLKFETNNDDSDELSKPSSSKGILKDRFTKDTIIITAPSKVKTSNDLQIPSMAPLLIGRDTRSSCCTCISTSSRSILYCSFSASEAQQDNNDTIENVNNNQAIEAQENNEQQQPPPPQNQQQAHFNIPVDENAAVAAVNEGDEARTSQHERLSPMDTTHS
ncbi:hypothetical protein PVAND_003617 [Polypedilum vanderplanki]|uniref:Uncharacterized protein n=1 Tax=Polypedilum vanderplanki TaxID=319348 RepID=A0A9J6BWF0_POLVA|nr:hypothetical protein PVAND_003617 [Polypedilum vanderplanki]